MIIKLLIGTIVLIVGMVTFTIVDKYNAIIITDVGSVRSKHYSPDYWIEDIHYPESYTVGVSKDGESFGSVDVSPNLYEYVDISDPIEIQYKIGKLTGWTYIVNINPI